MKTRLLLACGFCSLCASLPLHAAEGPTTQPTADALSERIASLTNAAESSKHDAPADTGEPSSEKKAAPKQDDAAANADADAGANKKKNPAKKKKGKGKKKQSAADAAAGRKISLEDDFLVEGKLDKPNAYYILRRSQAGYDWARLDAKFLPLVLESVQDPLF